MKLFAIKYTEDFTEDIYDRLVDWCNKHLITKGIRWYTYGHNGINSYKNFQEFENRPGWFRYIEKTVGVDNNTQGSPVISLQDLCEMIGYEKVEKVSKNKPFYVVVTEENKEVLSKFRFQNTIDKVTLKVGFIVGLYYWDYSSGLRVEYNDKVTNNWTNEISFEQFLELYPEYKQFVKVEDVKPQFEVGKWYDFNNPDYSGKCYAKLREEDPKEHFRFSEYIGNSKHKFYSGSWFASRCTGKLTDLSEIQQYLPRGHADKTPTMKESAEEKGADLVVLVVDEIYWCNSKTYPKGFLLKYRGLIDTCILTSGILRDDLKKFDTDKLTEYHQHNLRKATDEEKHWLEACIKANKFVSLKDSKKVTESVVPEYVECIKLPKGWGTYTKVGGIYKTNTSGYSNGSYRILYSEGGGQLTQGVEDYFKPSTKEAYDEQEKKKTMKVEEDLTGRYIKCLDDHGKGHYPCRKGDYLKFVSSKDSYEYWGAYLRELRSDGTENPRYHGKNVHKNSAFELMPVGFVPPVEKSVEEKWVPKIGDIVYWSGLSPTFGEVIHVDIEGTWCKLDVYGNKGTHTSCSFTYLRKATQEEVEDRLLKYARIKYPIGTQCKCLAYKKTETITSDLEWSNDKIMQIQDPCTIVYRNGKWAEIVSLSKDQIINKCISDQYEMRIDPIESQGSWTDKIDMKFLDKQASWITIISDPQEIKDHLCGRSSDLMNIKFDIPIVIGK
jgi:hypothetical protein